jgi:hypothetical protein
VATDIKITVLCDATSCSLVDKCRCFVGTRCLPENGDRRFLQDAGAYLSKYMLPHPRFPSLVIYIWVHTWYFMCQNYSYCPSWRRMLWFSNQISGHLLLICKWGKESKGEAVDKILKYSLIIRKLILAHLEIVLINVSLHSTNVGMNHRLRWF